MVAIQTPVAWLGWVVNCNNKNGTAGNRFRGVAKLERKNNKFESILFVILVVIAAYIILRSPYFDISQVIVSGNQYLADEVILIATPIYVGENIFKINLAEAAEQLKRVPMVKDVHIARDLPATVLINVTERRPLGILPTGNGFVEVDEEGLCLQRSASGVPGIPIITGIHVETVSPGDYIHNELLAEVLKVIGKLPIELTEELSEVNIDPDRQIKAYTLSHIPCYLGGTADMEEKGVVLLQLLLEINEQGKNVEYINISSVDKPAVKYK